MAGGLLVVRVCLCVLLHVFLEFGVVAEILQAPSVLQPGKDEGDEYEIPLAVINGEDEVPERAWERMSKADKDGDGAVTEDELKAAWKGRGGGPGKGPGGPGAMFERMDKNGDGKLAEDEVPAEMWAKVSKADEDADGLVSKQEMEKVFANRKGKGKGGQGEKGDGPKKRRPDVEETDPAEA